MDASRCTAERLFQLKVLIQAELGYSSAVIEGNVTGENSWLFQPGLYFDEGFILSGRGHISVLHTGGDPSDITDWINRDTPYTAVMSEQNDIIAFISRPEELSQILEICNSAALPY